VFTQVNLLRDVKIEKTCKGCKALKINSLGKPTCTLEYKLKNCIPLEECPKPMIYLDYVELVRDLKNTYCEKWGF